MNLRMLLSYRTAYIPVHLKELKALSMPTMHTTGSAYRVGEVPIFSGGIGFLTVEKVIPFRGLRPCP